MARDPRSSAGGPDRVRPASTAAGPSAGAQRVLDAALELFGRSGFEGTSLAQIADRMGITKAAVYYHFRTKNEILAALVRPAIADLEHLLATLERDPARAADRSERALRDLVDLLLRHEQVAGFVSRDVAAAGQPEVATPFRLLGGRVRELVTGQAVGDDEERLARLWGIAALSALSVAPLAVPNASTEWLREELVELGRHMGAGYRRARRRAAGPPPTS